MYFFLFLLIRGVCATEDRDIILLYEQRNEQAISETSARYGTLCRALARNITGSREDSEECVNDALLTVWNAIPPAKPQNFRAYVLRMVHNAAVNLRAKNTAKKRGGDQYGEALDELAESLSAPEQTDRQVEQRELMQAVQRYLGTLPRHQRDLFVRRYWYASSVSELASLFQMSENNVKVTLSRIRTRLQKYLRKEELL